ncbi:MAG: hypothetical protein NVS2B16_13220 [Chloroflexota bacterium]
MGAAGTTQSKWPRSNFSHQLTVQMAFAHSETPCEATDAVSIHDSLRNEPEGTRDEIGTHVPIRRTGSDIGTTPSAGAKPGRFRCCRARVKAHVRGARRLRGTDRPAVNTR